MNLIIFDFIFSGVGPVYPKYQPFAIIVSNSERNVPFFKSKMVIDTLKVPLAETCSETWNLLNVLHIHNFQRPRDAEGAVGGSLVKTQSSDGRQNVHLTFPHDRS